MNDPKSFHKKHPGRCPFICRCLGLTTCPNATQASLVLSDGERPESVRIYDMHIPACVYVERTGIKEYLHAIIASFVSENPDRFPPGKPVTWREAMSAIKPGYFQRFGAIVRPVPLGECVSEHADAGIAISDAQEKGDHNDRPEQ